MPPLPLMTPLFLLTLNMPSPAPLLAKKSLHRLLFHTSTHQARQIKMPVPRHVAVGAPDEPLPASKIPAFSSAHAVALVPIKAPEILDVYTKAVTQAANVKLQLGQDQIDDSTKGLIWLDTSSKGRPELEAILEKHKDIAWVQLSMAGINAYTDLIKVHSDKVWTSAKGAFAQPVAEHALTLTLALLRHIPMRVRAKSWGPR